MLRHRKGGLRIDGADLAAVAAHRVCGHGIALVPEGRRLFAGMTVEENLEIGCYRPKARTGRVQGLDRVYALFPVLGTRRRQIAGTLSGGQQQMVAIGRALMTDPRVLLLDEPSAGLAPKVVLSVFQTLPKLQAQGVSVLLAEQSLTFGLSVADRAYVIRDGRIVLAGTPAELAADKSVVKAYLGA